MFDDVSNVEQLFDSYEAVLYQQSSGEATLILIEDPAEFLDSPTGIGPQWPCNLCDRSITEWTSFGESKQANVLKLHGGSLYSSKACPNCREKVLDLLLNTDVLSESEATASMI